MLTCAVVLNFGGRSVLAVGAYSGLVGGLVERRYLDGLSGLKINSNSTLEVTN